MYQFSKAIKERREETRIARRLWIAYAVINSVVCGIALLIAIVYGALGVPINVNNVEALFLVILSVALAIAFPIYAIRLYRTVSHTSISSNRKQIMLKKVSFAFEKYQ
jgi:hypothetical protein